MARHIVVLVGILSIAGPVLAIRDTMESTLEEEDTTNSTLEALEVDSLGCRDGQHITVMSFNLQSFAPYTKSDGGQAINTHPGPWLVRQILQLQYGASPEMTPDVILTQEDGSSDAKLQVPQPGGGTKPYELSGPARIFEASMAKIGYVPAASCLAEQELKRGKARTYLVNKVFVRKDTVSVQGSGAFQGSDLPQFSDPLLLEDSAKSLTERCAAWARTQICGHKVLVASAHLTGGRFEDRAFMYGSNLHIKQAQLEAIREKLVAMDPAHDYAWIVGADTNGNSARAYAAAELRNGLEGYFNKIVVKDSAKLKQSLGAKLPSTAHLDASEVPFSTFLDYQTVPDMIPAAGGERVQQMLYRATTESFDTEPTSKFGGHVDHLYATPHVIVSKAAVVPGAFAADDTVSDHTPVVVEFAFPPPIPPRPPL